MRIAPVVAFATAKAAIETGIARRKGMTPEMVREKTIRMLAELNEETIKKQILTGVGDLRIPLSTV